MQTVETRYHGPTNTRGARISATSSDGVRVFVPYDHSLEARDCHAEAVHALRKKMGWWKDPSFTMHLAGNSKHGYIWCFDKQLSDPSLEYWILA